MIPYYPPAEGPFRLSLGLKVLDPADWIESDGRLAGQLALKATLLAERPDDVFQALPGSEPAQAELYDLLAAHLVAHFPDTYRRHGDGTLVVPTGVTVAPEPDAPLRATARLVQEDILLLEERDGSYHLVAGILCFPTRWRLKEKIGLPLAGIHAPVPGYAAKLERPMDRLFAGLTADRLLWRMNFSLVDDAALYQPHGHSDPKAGAGIAEADLGLALHFRVERQTLRRLPQTGAVVFTVRIHQAPLGQVVTTPERARDLRAVLDSMPADMRAYKSITAFQDALGRWLDAAAV